MLEAAPPTSIDADQLRRFGGVLWLPDDIIELRALFPTKAEGPPERRWIAAEALADPDTLAWLQAQQEAGRSLYAGVNPRKAMGGGTSADIGLARSVCADLEDTTVTAALRAVRGAGLPDPSLILTSGGGVHLYWALEQALLDFDLWRRTQRGIIDAIRAESIEADKGIHDPPRVMRLPGTLNVKRGARAELVLAEADRRYAIGEFPVSPGSPVSQERQERQGGPPVTPANPVPPVPPVTPAARVAAVAVFDRYQPTGPRRRRRLLIRIVRDLKFGPYGRLGPFPFRPLVLDWHRRYAQSMSGQDGPEDSWLDFLGLWNDLTQAICQGVHDRAFVLAAQEPAPGVEASFEDPEYRLLVSACYHLEQLFGGVPWGLSCRTVARYIDGGHERAHRMLRRLCVAGVIECVERGKPGAAGSKASRFQYRGIAAWAEGGIRCD